MSISSRKFSVLSLMKRKQKPIATLLQAVKGLQRLLQAKRKECTLQNIDLLVRRICLVLFPGLL